MIINPSPLYIEKYGPCTGIWEFVGCPDNSNFPYFYVVCSCNLPKVTTQIPTDFSEHAFKVELKADRFRNKEAIVTIWIGQCENCEKFYWACNDFKWVAWLNDLETVAMLLNNTPIRNTLSLQTENNLRIGYSFIDIKETHLIFYKGKLEREKTK